MKNQDQHVEWTERPPTQAEQEQEWLDIYHNCCAVYIHFRTSGQPPKMINSVHRYGSEKCEIIDLLCDLELKAHRECIDDTEWLLVQNCNPELLPRPLQLRLGAAWLNIYQEYATLFNSLIKAQHRERQRELRKAQQEAEKSARALDDGFEGYTNEEVQQNSEDTPQDIAA
jgi:hypothetical protein